MNKKNISLLFKGFAMGTADIVPGVSGGTIALITGIYDELVKTISGMDHELIKLVLKADFKGVFEKMNLKFLIPLGLGIGSALLIMARLMHYLMENYSVFTWSAFFGLILASIIILLKTIDGLKSMKNYGAVIMGGVIGFAVVTLIPVQTPETLWMTLLSGMIGICAMILPGISGSFILLILGKYYFITGMIKNPFQGDHLLYIGVFCLGCLIGLISFSKILNHLLEKKHALTMCVLVGFMIGSLKKIWPWKTLDPTLAQNIDPKKAKLLADELFIPTDLNSEVIFALIIMIISFGLVYFIERSITK